MFYVSFEFSDSDMQKAASAQDTGLVKKIITCVHKITKKKEKKNLSGLQGLQNQYLMSFYLFFPVHFTSNAFAPALSCFGIQGHNTYPLHHGNFRSLLHIKDWHSSTFIALLLSVLLLCAVFTHL